MKAVYVERTGPPEVLTYGELPEPQPDPNDVLIRVRATSLNRLDVFMREGSHGTSITPPQILGRDMAGEVVQVGSAVSDFQPGDRVVASGNGSYAEYALAPVERTFHLPANCSFDDGGALPTAGLTAYQMLINRARVRPGEDVLVIAAGSGVSSYAIQIARAVGARVIATAGSDEKLHKAREIGADRSVAGLFPQPQGTRPPGHLWRDLRVPRRVTPRAGVYPCPEYHGRRTWLTRRHAAAAALARSGTRTPGDSPALSPARSSSGASPTGEFQVLWQGAAESRLIKGTVDPPIHEAESPHEA
jgi:hypothetical protein